MWARQRSKRSEMCSIVAVSSAAPPPGAMILASYIPARDSLAVSAFEFLPHATIAPHYTQRHNEAELRRDLERHPGLRGIGIDEATAIVVHGHEFEVIGGGTVTVVDHHVTVLTRG